jgi:methyl-accepting chemotaxis protein
VRCDALCRRAFGSISRKQKGNAETLDRVVAGVLDNARHVSMSASQASAAVTQVSGGARSQLDAVKQVASALGQSAEAITEVARSTNSASQQSREITGLLGKGTEQVTGMVTLVRGIAEDSTQIARIVADISQIADQTNMLALNAAIEAAHGGQNSGGFTVIADEVRKLSENTHALAQKIGEIIGAAGERVQSGLKMAHDISNSIGAIGDIVRRNEGLVAAIATSVEQQQSVIADIRLSVNELNNIGQANASASEEIAVTMHQLADLAGETNRQMEGVRRGS